VNVIQKPRYLPDLNNLSVVAATMLLAYALARFSNFPLSNLAIQLPGLFLSLQINLRTLVSILVAGLAAAGAGWLISDHPSLSKNSRPEHFRMYSSVLIPSLTAWIIGVPLFQLPIGVFWWMGFAIGGAILMLVLVAEYIVVDPNDVRQPIASAGLTVVSFSLYLILAASLRYANLRLFLILPALTLAAALISLRTLHLRLRGQWAWLHAGIVTFIIGQLVAAFHYLPLSPVAYALALVGAAYGLTSLMDSLLEGASLRQALIEPLVIVAIFWATALWVR
jgi:hypothetical protein